MRRWIIALLSVLGLVGGVALAASSQAAVPQYKSLHANFNSVPFGVQGHYTSGGGYDLAIQPGWTWATPSTPDSFYIGAGCYADMGYNYTSDGMRGGRFYGPRYVTIGFGVDEEVWVSAHC